MSSNKLVRGYLFYIMKESPAKTLNPITRLFIMLSISVASFITNRYEIILGLLTLTVLLIVLSKIPFSLAKKFFLALFGMATGIFIINIFFSHYEGSTIYLDLWVFKIPNSNFGWRIYVTDNTLYWATLLFLRTVVMVWISLWFLVVTNDRDIIYALRKIGFPRSIAFIFALSLRSISMFYEDFRTVMEAMKSRGVNFNEGSIISRFKKYAVLTKPLILLALRRIEEFTRAIEARGFSVKTKKTMSAYFPFNIKDAIIILASISIILFVWLYQNLMNPSIFTYKVI